MSGKSRIASAKGVQEFKTYITRSLPVQSIITCADNTGAKTLMVIQVSKFKGRKGRKPAASIGDHVTVVVKKGPPDLRRQTFGAVIVRQKYPVRRITGNRIAFEDNAAVLMTPEGEMKGTDIKGPVAAEAAEQWPRIANLSSMIV